MRGTDSKVQRILLGVAFVLSAGLGLLLLLVATRALDPHGEVVEAPDTYSVSDLPAQQRQYTMIALAVAAGTTTLFFGLALTSGRYIRRLEAMANRDPLTGLKNRTSIVDQLDAMVHKQQEGDLVAVVAVDLDHFKEVNDLSGHEAGDRVLVEIAARIEDAVDHHGTIGRLGGDEFIVIIHASDEAILPRDVARRVVAAIGQPIIVESFSLELGASAGYSVRIFGDDKSVSQMLREADIALHVAKTDGPNVVRSYEKGMETQLHRDERRRTELREAIERNEFTFHFQPEIDLRTGALVGAETLMRWEHPLQGLLTADRFIEDIERFGFLPQLLPKMIQETVALAQGLESKWIREALAEPGRKPVVQAAGRRAQPGREETGKDSPTRTAPRRTGAASPSTMPYVTMRLNLAAEQLSDPRLLPFMRSAGKDAPGTRFCFEVTERSVLDASPETIATLGHLHAMGISIALDDFGTGVSSLRQLHKLPVDALKIDRSFVLDLTTHTGQESIASMLVRLGTVMDLDIIAEGIEDETQRRALVQMGCPTGQGYLFGRPIPPVEFLRTWGAPVTIDSC